jgi:pyrroloquinoline quinone (PQQ) biosynthesis protein C
MSTAAATSNTTGILSGNSVKNELVGYLKELKTTCGTLSRDQIAFILGQWFHPLHYFPTFLSRLISVTPDIETQTFISRILWEELGEGDPQRAHEKIYKQTMTDGGFTLSEIGEASPSTATRELVAGYETSSTSYLAGLGFLYGTEVVDLSMVSTIGELMRRSTGRRNLPWVAIHVAQEPGHVESSNETLKPLFTADEQQQIVENAERMWRLWINFFQSIGKEIRN